MGRSELGDAAALDGAKALAMTALDFLCDADLRERARNVFEALRGVSPSVPKLHESVFVAPGAQIYGEVEIDEGASVWHNAVIRAECEIAAGRPHDTNLQDFVMVHVGYDHPTAIGDFCSITHHATVHGATIERRTAWSASTPW